MTTETLEKKEYHLSRFTWAFTLTIASVASMIMMYAMQGVLATGQNPADLPDWFWTADVIGWGFRAVIEGMVIFFLFRTEAKKQRDKATLLSFEIALILLIIGTQGPTLYSLSANVPISDALDGVFHWAWCFGLGAYGALMIGAAGVAYRIQPSDIETIPLVKHSQTLELKRKGHESQLAKLQTELDTANSGTNADVKAANACIADLTAELDKRDAQLSSQQAIVTQAQAKVQHLQRWQDFVKSSKFTTAKELARWIGFVSAGGKMPAPGPLAKKTLGVTAAAIREALKEGEALGLDWATDDQPKGA